MNNYIFFSLPANIRQECNLDFQIVISSKVEKFRQLLWKIVSLGRMKKDCVMCMTKIRSYKFHTA